MADNTTWNPAAWESLQGLTVNPDADNGYAAALRQFLHANVQPSVQGNQDWLQGRLAVQVPVNNNVRLSYGTAVGRQPGSGMAPRLLGQDLAAQLNWGNTTLGAQYNRNAFDRSRDSYEAFLRHRF